MRYTLRLMLVSGALLAQSPTTPPVPPMNFGRLKLTASPEFVQIHIRVTPAQPFRLERSVNLVEWTGILELAASNWTSVEVVDSAGASAFYRVK